MTGKCFSIIFEVFYYSDILEIHTSHDGGGVNVEPPKAILVERSELPVTSLQRVNNNLVQISMSGQVNLTDGSTAHSMKHLHFLSKASSASRGLNTGRYYTYNYTMHSIYSS
jgi:hypothetical protein